MRSKKVVEMQVLKMKRQIDAMSKKSDAMKELLEGKLKAEDTGANLLTLLKYLMDENRKNAMIMKGMANNLEYLTKVESDLNAASDQHDQTRSGEPGLIRELPLSGLDARIIQIIQTSKTGMACAADIQKAMGYKGLNAACARLNGLYRQGLLERFQLGHKVYYRYSALGKSTNTLIVSPPQ